VVHRLHPDIQRDMTAQKTEWWHQAQAAYEAGDVKQMEVILTLCEIGDSGTTAHTSASLWQRITAHLKKFTSRNQTLACGAAARSRVEFFPAAATTTRWPSRRVGR
jgi:hypothetical protein